MTIKVRIILAFCLSILVLLLIGMYAYKTTNEYKDASDWVNHTQQAISEAQNILLDIKDIETAQRGYVITGEIKYLDPYKRAAKSTERRYLVLRNLVVDNKSQQALIDSIYYTIRRKMDFAKRVISVRQQENFEAAQQLIMTSVGENLMKKIRSLNDDFVKNENTLLSERLSLANQNFTSTVNTILTSISLAIVIILVTLYFFIVDHNKRLYSERKALESELRAKQFLESLPVGIFVMDKDGNPYYANDKSQEILGKGIVPGMSAEQFPEIYKTYIAGTEDIYPVDKMPIVRAMKGEKNICVEDMEVLKNDVRIPLRINATYLTNLEEKIEYAIAVFEDISDVKEAEKKLIEAKILAEQSATLKEAFLANMSHEIRTPMNAILGFTDLLLKRNLENQERDYVKTIKNSGENLLRIINDVLDVSKIESGGMAFEEHPMSIKELFPSLNAMLGHKAKEKKLNLSFGYDENLPEVILGDPARLTQIMVNLVGNAIKFTAKGNVEVYAKVIKEEKKIYQIEISVKDTGIGIPQDKLQDIFERFRQAESHTTRHYGGTGLGLSIAKQLVELQGGEISVKSIIGVGSVFSFILPFKKIGKTKNIKQKTNKGVNIQELSKVNILLVEDNPVNVKFILGLFSLHNIKADVAENGKIAIEKIKQKVYDVVLMDIEMPEMNGYETTEHIRKTLKLDIPIIAMTANAMAGEREKCLQLDMNDYISKPIREEILLEKLYNEALAKSENKSGVDQKKNLVNLGFLIDTMKGKKDIIIETIDVVLQQIPEDVSAIKDAISRQDYAGIRRFSHRMKSTVSIIGISDVEAILEEMESLSTAQKDMERIIYLNQSLILLNEKIIKEIEIEKLKYV